MDEIRVARGHPAAPAEGKINFCTLWMGAGYRTEWNHIQMGSGDGWDQDGRTQRSTYRKFLKYSPRRLVPVYYVLRRQAGP